MKQTIKNILTNYHKLISLTISLIVLILFVISTIFLLSNELFTLNDTGYGSYALRDGHEYVLNYFGNMKLAASIIKNSTDEHFLKFIEITATDVSTAKTILVFSISGLVLLVNYVLALFSKKRAYLTFTCLFFALLMILVVRFNTLTGYTDLKLVKKANDVLKTTINLFIVTCSISFVGALYELVYDYKLRLNRK